jgi:[ribosomal protein S18]-alanine N-acetyltransferase
MVPFPFLPADLPRLLVAQNGHTFSLETAEHGDLPGFGQWYEKGNWVIRLARIIVSAFHRGRGIGKALCQLLMENAVGATAVGTFVLSIYRDNPSAIAAYSGLGFGRIEAMSDA